jgi:NADPH:quinone reductase-like Zn-dependent oxidoreductase
VELEGLEQLLLGVVHVGDHVSGFGSAAVAGWTVLGEIVALVDAGEFVVDIAESHPLSDVTSIHQRSEAGETRGKIVILP